MRKPFVYAVGGILSADIAVPDHPRELGFYSRILTTGDVPLWRDDLMNNLGTPIIGLGVRTPEYESLPLQWMPHFQVADVVNSANRASELGGKVLMQSDTDDSQSQWAVIVDPFGAAFGVIPVVAKESKPADQNEHFGCISWLALTVGDAQSSRDFYQQVVGWNAKSVEANNSEGQVARFEMQIDDETIAAEICQCDIENGGIPAVWLIHLSVGDLTESLRRVGENGGEVIKEFAKTKSAVVRDPAGVYLALQAHP